MQQPSSDLLWQHLKTLPAFRALLRAVEARFYHQFDIPGPILDLGCGDGDFANHTFNEFGQKIDVGFDPWLQPLKESVKHNFYKDGALQAMGDEMPFPSNHFGAVISNSVLEHIPDITPVLIEAGRVLKPGGVFLMTMPNHRFDEMLWGALFFEKFGLKRLADQYRRFFAFVARHQHTEPVEWWADQLAQAGLTVERWQYYFSPAALHTLEFGHVQGLPSLFTHALTGKWIIAPIRESLALTDRWVRPYYLEQADEAGTYQFILARKVSDGPIEPPDLPEAQPFEVLPNGDLKKSQLLTPIHEADIRPIAIPLTKQNEPNAQNNRSQNAVIPSAEVQKKRPFSLPSAPAITAVLVGLLLSIVTLFLTDGRGPDRPWASIMSWMLAITIAGVGLAWSDPSFNSLPRKLIAKLTPQNPITPAILFSLAWLVRAWNLRNHPWIPSGTEAATGLEKLLALSGYAQNPFGTDGLTNPLLPYFLTSFTEPLFGPSVFALRVLSPIIGALTVLLVYWVGRRFWGEIAGLGGAILLLGNHTHIHYSRLGLTNIWDPLFMLASAALIVIAWQKRGRIAWLMVGLVSGLSFYFYTAAHLLPAVIPLLMLTLLFTDELRKIWAPDSILPGESSSRDLLRSISASAILCLIIILPLLAHYNRNPGRFTDRLVRQGVIQTNWIDYQSTLSGLSPSAVWRGQLLDSFSIFSLAGTPDQSLYYGGQLGIMTFAPTLFALIGLTLVLMQIRRAENQMLLWLLAVSIFGAGLLLLNPPQSHRYLVLLPVTALLGGSALQWLADFYQSRATANHHKWLIVAAITITSLSIIPDLNYYFGRWQQSHTFADPNTEIAFEIANYLNQLPANSTVYLQTEPALNASFPTIGYLAPQFRTGENIIQLPILNQLAPELSTQGATVFILLPERIDELEPLRSSFPEGEVSEVSGYFADPLFTVFEVAK